MAGVGDHIGAAANVQAIFDAVQTRFDSECTRVKTHSIVMINFHAHHHHSLDNLLSCMACNALHCLWCLVNGIYAYCAGQHVCKKACKLKPDEQHGA